MERHITVIGAGIAGLWQALMLRQRGHRVRLVEQSPAEDPFATTASRYAAGMLAPYCEEEGAEPIVRRLGEQSMGHWRLFDHLITHNGSLVVARARDRSELERFARLTSGHEWLDDDTLRAFEPDLAGRFSRALYFASEGHMAPRRVLAAILAAFRALGGEVAFGVDASAPETADDGGGDWIIDCRGLGARDDLDTLRGVRGEMAVLRTSEVSLTRPVRLLHPRFPIYVVPWADDTFMVGATVIQSEDRGGVSARSMLELLGTAYALHPAFGEAEVVELGADARPAFADNIPKIVQRGRRLYVNGMYRHGYLTAPALAEITAGLIEGQPGPPEVVIEDRGQH